MNNLIVIGGEKAVIAFDPEIQMLRGEFVGLNGGADFYAESVRDLIEEGRKSLTIYLDMCREKGVEPRRKFSGKFNVRLAPGDHAAAVTAAAAAGKSLNEWIVGAIREAAELGGAASQA
jgi:predicted HicB family RNase H-like nuclease